MYFISSSSVVVCCLQMDFTLYINSIKVWLNYIYKLNLTKLHVDHNFKCPEGKSSCTVEFILFITFFINLAWMGSYCVYLWILQTIQISQNITTNEKINWRHYRYMQDEVGIKQEKGWEDVMCRIEISAIPTIAGFSAIGSSFGAFWEMEAIRVWVFWMCRREMMSYCKYKLIKRGRDGEWQLLVDCDFILIMKG